MPVGVGSGCRKLSVEMLHGRAVSRQLVHFGRSLWDGEGRGGGMPGGGGSACCELMIELFPDGPFFDN